MIAGCDPMTMTQIRNDTGSTVTIQVILDSEQWNRGFRPGEYEKWLSDQPEEWLEAELRAYASGPDGDELSKGVELLSFDRESLAGEYRLQPAAVMILNRSMGSIAFHPLSELIVINGAEARRYSGAEEIRELFERDENDEIAWTFELSDAF
jgi:hypothetical protein